ncbi:hypothetical protein GCM10020260_15620 [Nesterenkonia halobia]|uniref:Uncharacterized protein n=1 Tax=Nesterenkonia halobia TaxID=37922 RepID=A0ABP6RCD4_9MICC
MLTIRIAAAVIVERESTGEDGRPRPRALPASSPEAALGLELRAAASDVGFCSELTWSSSGVW